MSNDKIEAIAENVKETKKFSGIKRLIKSTLFIRIRV